MALIQSGVLEKTRVVSNLLLVVLLAGNLFFSVQYIENLKQSATTTTDQSTERYQAAHFLNLFINTVLSTQGTISYDQRVELENDILQIHDPILTAQWEAFVGSKDPATAQANAVKLMSLLSARMV